MTVHTIPFLERPRSRLRRHLPAVKVFFTISTKHKPHSAYTRSLPCLFTLPQRKVLAEHKMRFLPCFLPVFFSSLQHQQHPDVSQPRSSSSKAPLKQRLQSSSQEGQLSLQLTSTAAVTCTDSRTPASGSCSFFYREPPSYYPTRYY